ncbi:hypothetical protein FHW36_10685 [Chitinophaga polysaccharea]|uniref:Uncharacterized protein n=1 Tax=Chitinophaga polysaccharea TaxID=1293035 RepID=A0A561PL78_9BACT|nr:hypothetical protein [Chitinophaga polysaccharea]TWF38862.1 hypothetical protein FHW36_10685 [Chitinophaga polysaccharea]
MKERIVAFASGDLLAMFGMWHVLDIQTMFVDIAFKVAITGVLGIVGGFTGLLGKDLYIWYKKHKK